jgi:transcription antitermination factor NusG
MSSRHPALRVCAIKTECWYLLKIREAFEAAVCQSLENKNIDVFLPASEQQKARRKYPLPGYVFCRFSLQDKDAILAIPGVICIVGTPRPVAIDDYDIAEMQASIAIGTYSEQSIGIFLKKVLRANVIDILSASSRQGAHR